MTEPGEEELERAERIRKLRSGGAESRSRAMRERRRERSDRERPDGTADEGAADDADGADGTADGAADDGAADDGADPGDGAPVPLGASGDADVLELAADLPEDGSLFVVPVREELRREFTKVAEQLHLRYGFEYRRELDVERHVRPLALYLGVQALEDADVEVVDELLDSVDELAAPEPVDEG